LKQKQCNDEFIAKVVRLVSWRIFCTCLQGKTISWIILPDIKESEQSTGRSTIKSPNNNGLFAHSDICALTIHIYYNREGPVVTLDNIEFVINRAEPGG